MVRMQDDECEKTGEFLRGAMERVRFLGRPSSAGYDANNDEGKDASIAPSSKIKNKPTKSNDSGSDEAPEGMLTYLEMRRALLRLGFTWNRSLPPSPAAAASNYQYDDDVSIASEASRSSRVSGASGKVLGGKRKKRDVLATDNQLIMLLSILVEMEERWRVDHMNNNGDNDDDICAKGLFLPELIQAYKLVIGGMQSLQSLQRNYICQSTTISRRSSSSALTDDKELSERLRQRTKGLLRSFGPNHKLSLNQSLLSPYSKSKSGKSRDGLSPTSKQLFPSSPTRIQTKALTDAAFQQPRLGEDSIRKLMHNKDATLAKIVEEHEVEMDALAQNIEVLKEKEMSSREILIKKRRKTKWLFVMGLAIMSSVAGYWEYQRRLWVQNQIAMGREEERRKSSQEIERLTLQRDGLQKKLDTAEGTARYQHSRLLELEVLTNRTLEDIGSIEQRWWLDQAEMGRCRTSIKEIENGMLTLTASIEELEEEQGWCTNRLQGRDAELNSLRYAKSTDFVSASTADRGLAIVGAAASEQQQQPSKNHKPVKLEMKYNRSVRNAMMLRQVYSGVGGITLSMVARVMFPHAFSFLSLPAASVAPITKKAATVAAPKKLLMNVKWVDRIHAATVVLLVVRTAVLFFMP